MTTSANIAGTIRPFAVAGHGTKPWPYGSSKVYEIGELKPKKKKKKERTYGQVGMIYVDSRPRMIGEAKTAMRKHNAYTEPVGDPKKGMWKIPSLGKVGVWRTVRGRRYFFPTDGSGSVPKMPGAKGAKKKGGLLSKIAGLFGGGSGAKAKVKDVKAKPEKKDEKKLPASKQIKRIDDMMAKAKKGGKSGKQLMGPLKNMKKALEKRDPDAIKKASAALGKASEKLAKRKQ